MADEDKEKSVPVPEVPGAQAVGNSEVKQPTDEVDVPPAVYDTDSRRLFGRPFPDELRCTAWKKVCDCGHRFPGTDLYGGKKKGAANRITGVPPGCPECGRPRPRCRSPKVRGSNVCRFHGGNGRAGRKAAVPGNFSLDDEELLALEGLMAEDDTSLRREFHTLRIFFGHAMEQFKAAVDTLGSDRPADVIGEAARLAIIIDRLSTISDRRAKVKEPVVEQLLRVQFEDPRVKYLIKEAMRDIETQTIKRVLAAVLACDPGGELGLADRLPPSFVPYLPDTLSLSGQIELKGELVVRSSDVPADGTASAGG